MRIIYRPEIDGLRAISVVSVIIYHANFVLFGNTFFTGGFIGVDIFFVISGYLITAIILKEIRTTNQFSFKNFYESRVRRILPALLFVTIITSILSFFILLPLSLIDFGKSILGVIFFISNFYFWITGGRYGDDSELLRPLLHTWSLSVEEQFYIFFPILFLAIFKFFKKDFYIILFIFFFLSLIFAQWASSTNLKVNYLFFNWSLIFFEKFNFYSLQSRIFELIIGSLLSYFELRRTNSRKSHSLLNKLCPTFGIILILYSFLFFNFNRIFHPSIITLFPLLGVSLVIWFSKKGELITKILSNKIFVFIGLISYSLYLWHYPIFAFLRYIELFNNSFHIKLLAILLTIILSILSYYFIEVPFRNKKIISLKKLINYILISIIILLSYSFFILKTEGIKSRLPNIMGEKLREGVHPNKFNRLSENQKKLYLIGDSHADVLTYNLHKELVKDSYNFYRDETFLFLKDFNQINKKTGSVNKDYYEINNKIYNFIRNHDNLVIVWHQRWALKFLEEKFNNEEGYTEYQTEHDRYSSVYLEPLNIKTLSIEERQKYIIEGINLLIKEILERGHILILVYPVPEMGFDAQKIIIKKNIFSYIFNKDYEIPLLSSSYKIYKKRNKIIFDTLDYIKHPNLYRVYPDQSFCNNIIINRCLANNKNHLFYFDQDHLSLEGTKYVVNDIMKIIQQIKINN